MDIIKNNQITIKQLEELEEMILKLQQQLAELKNDKKPQKNI